METNRETGTFKAIFYSDYVSTLADMPRGTIIEIRVIEHPRRNR